MQKWSQSFWPRKPDRVWPPACPSNLLHMPPPTSQHCSLFPKRAVLLRTPQPLHLPFPMPRMHPPAPTWHFLVTHVSAKISLPQRGLSGLLRLKVLSRCSVTWAYFLILLLLASVCPCFLECELHEDRYLVHPSSPVTNIVVLNKYLLTERGNERMT